LKLNCLSAVRELLQRYQGLKEALAAFAQTYAELQQGAVWLRDIADILALPDESGLSAKQVVGHLSGYLDALYPQRDLSPMLHAFSEHLDTVSQSYWPGLFHCYDVAGLARTNKGLESHFRDTQRRLLRTTGQKGQTRRTLHRLGAWELLDRRLTEAEAMEALSRMPAEDLAQERQRLHRHRQRFRFHMRSLNGSDVQFEKLRHSRFAHFEIRFRELTQIGQKGSTPTPGNFQNRSFHNNFVALHSVARNVFSGLLPADFRTIF
jgi:hypothetical protein